MKPPRPRTPTRILALCHRGRLRPRPLRPPEPLLAARETALQRLAEGRLDAWAGSPRTGSNAPPIPHASSSRRAPSSSSPSRVTRRSQPRRTPPRAAALPATPAAGTTTASSKRSSAASPAPSARSSMPMPDQPSTTARSSRTCLRRRLRDGLARQIHDAAGARRRLPGVPRRHRHHPRTQTRMSPSARPAAPARAASSPAPPARSRPKATSSMPASASATTRSRTAAPSPATCAPNSATGFRLRRMPRCCPVGASHFESHPEIVPATIEDARPALAPLLALDEAAFLERYRGRPIMRAKRDGFVRNVCVALGIPAGNRPARPPHRPR